MGDLISSDSSSRSHAEHPAGPPGGAHPPVPVHKASVPDDSSDAIDDDEDSDNYLVSTMTTVPSAKRRARTAPRKRRGAGRHYAFSGGSSVHAALQRTRRAAAFVQ